MTEELQTELLSQLLSESEIARELKIRKSNSYNESYSNGSKILEEKISEGWQVKTELKTKTKIHLPKALDIAFEDKVWSLFALLGFKLMNKDRHFHIPYDKKIPLLTQQFE